MLSVKSIHKKYEENTLFSGVSFEIPLNAFVALTGVNGIGKSTLLRILSGLISFEGDCFIESISLKENYARYMGKIAYLPNVPFLYDYLTLSEMAALLQTHLQKKNKPQLEEKHIAELFEQLHLEKFRHTLAKNLSLGTKQKIAFLLGFLSKPKLILLDEPFVNLDAHSLKFSLDFIQRYVKDNEAIVLFATHSHENNALLRDRLTHYLTIEDEKNIILHKRCDIK